MAAYFVTKGIRFLLLAVFLVIKVIRFKAAISLVIEVIRFCVLKSVSEDIGFLKYMKSMVR